VVGTTSRPPKWIKPQLTRLLDEASVTSEKVGTMTKVFFITHPEVDVDPQIPITEWKLSARGMERMCEMLKQKWIPEIQHIFASDERKAKAAAEILARHLSLGLSIEVELGENDRSSTGFLPPQEFEAMANLFFLHPHQSIRGWEIAKVAQGRIVRAVTSLMQTAPPGAVAIVAHGGVGTLLLCWLKGVPISRLEDQPSQGHFFVFQRDSLQLLHGWRPIDASHTADR
jgi:broad specificity phosphatase PhoE